MKKIAFVVPWYGDKIPGGAEMETREVIKHLIADGIETEVLTTCAKEFASDWYVDYYKPGSYMEDVVPVKRFAVRKGNAERFVEINTKLLKGFRISGREEKDFLENIINSDDLYQYMQEHEQEYSLFIFIPYMFGTTFYGAKMFPGKTILIPCFHDECYAYFRAFRRYFSKVRGIVYNAEPERKLANKLYHLDNVKQITMGIGMDVDISGSAERFREKYGIEEPFILYAGRKDETKNVHTLIHYFDLYRKEKNTDLQLVLIGPGELPIPESSKEAIHDLGFVSVQDKYDAYAAAELLCQPSKNESFSFVIMESWLMGRPVMVHEACKVTSNFVRESNGGLYFRDYFEFAEEVTFIIENSATAKIMGEQGRMYVRTHFAWDTVTQKYRQFLRECSMEESL